jgi:hypothetical protein
MEYKPIDRPVIYAPAAVRVFGVEWYASALHFRGRLEVLDADTAEIRATTAPIERRAALWRRLDFRAVQRWAGR